MEKTLAATLSAHSGRHADLPASFRKHQLVAHRLPSGVGISSDRADLIGAYLTRVRHRGGGTLQPVHRRPPGPGQPRARRPSLRHDGTRRRRGTSQAWSSEAGSFQQTTSCNSTRQDAPHDRPVTQSTTSTEFLREALDEDGDAVTAQSVLGRLPEHFTPRELEDVLASSELDSPRRRGPGGLLERIRSRAASSYELTFASTSDLSERVVFPTAEAESHGIEDARLVRFVDEDDRRRYYATYTAYDGSGIAPHLLSTTDFETFSMRPQLGPAAKNKGMALFPRRIAGRFESLALGPGVNQRDHLGRRAALGTARHHAATHAALGAHPARPMLVPARDIPGMGRHHPRGRPDADVQPRRRPARPQDPTIVLGTLTEPLMTAGPDERDGYVPNVLYSCGGLIHGETIVLPYGCSDFYPLRLHRPGRAARPAQRRGNHRAHLRALTIWTKLPAIPARRILSVTDRPQESPCRLPDNQAPRQLQERSQVGAPLGRLRTVRPQRGCHRQDHHRSSWPTPRSRATHSGTSCGRSSTAPPMSR